MQIEISKVNKILTEILNISSYRFKELLPSHYKIITEQEGAEWQEEGSGYNGEYYYILEYESLYIKVTLYTDSYGSIENGKGISFVKPKVVEVTNYEAI